MTHPNGNAYRSRALLRALAVLVLALSTAFVLLSSPIAAGAVEDDTTEEPADEAPPEDDESEPTDDESTEDNEPAQEPGEVSVAVWVGVGILVVAAVAFAVRESTKSS